MKFEMIHMVLLLRIRVGLLLVDALKLSAATMRALPRILDILIALYIPQHYVHLPLAQSRLSPIKFSHHLQYYWNSVS